MKQFKKIFAFTIAALMIAAYVVGATHDNAEIKFKSQTSISMATVGAMVGKVPGSRKAGVYKWLKDKYPNNPVIAESYIRMEAYLVNGKAEYEFFHKMMGNESPTERKLNEQDAFRMTDIGIYLMQESTTVAGIGVLQTYPNPIQFPDEAGFMLNAHLEHIYNGFLTAKIGDTTWLPDLPVQDCRIVNTAQQTALATNDSERRAGDGLIPLTPQYTLKGRENNSIKLIVPANSNQKVESVFGTTGYKVKVVCIVRGFKVTGAGNS